MKNWKTTLGGVVGMVGTLLAAGPGVYHYVGVGLVSAAVTWLGYHAVDATPPPADAAKK